MLGVPAAFTPIATQSSEVWVNAHGGFRGDTVYTGLLTFGGNVDLDALGIVPGGSVQLVALGIQGGNISNAVGDAGIVSNIAGQETVRLFNWWYEQTWLDDRLALKGGQVALDSDFMVIDAAQLFLSSGFGTPQTEALNTPAPIYPLGALGARLRVDLNPLTLRVGVYDGDAGAEKAQPHTSDLALDGSSAVITAVELSWQATEKAKATLGGFAHAGEFPDQETGELVRGLGSAYAAYEHTLGRWRGSELVAFARVAGAFPVARTAVVLYGDAGLVLSGGAWRRPDDRLGLGVAHTLFGDDHVRAERAAGQDVSLAETVLELTYELVPLPWIRLQPSGQVIVGPHFSHRDAVVLGFRGTISF